MEQSAAACTRVAICVPARNEAEGLPRLFAAVDRLDRHDVEPVLCLVLDSCNDRSAAVARDYAADALLPVWIDHATQPEPNVGRARHRAMLLGERALSGSGLLLTTDADSLPAVDWLQTMVAALGHADVVAGKVVRTVTRPNAVTSRSGSRECCGNASRHAGVSGVANV